MQQNSRCYLVFLNVYQTETNVSLAEMWCPGLRNPPCPALLAFGPEQKVCAVCGLHKSTFMVILALYVVVVNIFRIYIVFQLNHHRLEAGGFGLAAESSLKLTNLEVIALLSFF